MREPGGSVWCDGVLVDGNAAALPLSDAAVQYGLALFETIAVRHGRLVDLEPHLDRLVAGGERLGLAIDRERIGRAALERAAAEDAPAAWLKIIATAGGRRLVFTGAMDPDEEGRPATAVILPWRRNLQDPLTGLKTLNYGASFLGLEEARRRGADEGLWLNTRGHLAEGSRTNVFVVRQRKLFTPGTGEGILPGVVRAQVLGAARELGLHVHETRVRLKRLREADEAFLTSSLRAVRPLVRVGGRAVGDGEPGRITARLAREVSALRTASLTPPALAPRTGRTGQGEGRGEGT